MSLWSEKNINTKFYKVYSRETKKKEVITCLCDYLFLLVITELLLHHHFFGDGSFAGANGVEIYACC